MSITDEIFTCPSVNKFAFSLVECFCLFRLCLESRRQPKYKMAKVNSGKERVPLLMSVLCLFFIFIQRMRICKPENNSYTILFFEIYFLRSVNISYKINDMPFWMTRYCSVFRYLNTQSLLQYCN